MVRQDDAPGTIEARGAGAPPGGAEARAGEPHAARVVVWDAPAAVERGARFLVRVGAACSAGCRAAGWAVEVRDHEGRRQAAARLGGEPWRGTDALHHARVALTAPDVEGLHAWEAVVLTNGLPVAHTDARAGFGVRVVPAPACLLTVAARDAESGAPVAGARVAAHPYRAVTDERGVARLRVPAGEYRLFVSGRGYVPFRFEGKVRADTTIRAELERDVELSEADVWP